MILFFISLWVKVLDFFFFRSILFSIFLTSFTPSYLVLCASVETGAGRDPALFWKLTKHVSTATRKCHVSHQRNSGKAFQFLFTRSYNSISPSRLPAPAALRSLFICLLRVFFPSVTHRKKIVKKIYSRRYTRGSTFTWA